MNTTSIVFGTILATLLTLIAGNLVYNDSPNVTQATMAIPMSFEHWQGTDLMHNPGELAVLEGASLIKREYENPHEELVWLIAQQTSSLNRLHNVYVSLVASGSKPRPDGVKTIQTKDGPLQVTVIHLQNTQGEPYLGYLWYQWRDQNFTPGNAPSRWRWYIDVAQMRLKKQVIPWRIVEVITPKSTQPEADYKRLNTFAEWVYTKT